MSTTISFSKYRDKLFSKERYHVIKKDKKKKEDNVASYVSLVIKKQVYALLSDVTGIIELGMRAIHTIECQTSIHNFIAFPIQSIKAKTSDQ